MPKELFTELAESTKTIQVKYADAPLRLNGIPQEISVEELYKKVAHPFTYSNALFSTEKHPSYLAESVKKIDLSAHPLIKKFKEIGFADTSSLVICNMGSLGHGVFANKDFEPGECFILYAGIITDTSLEECHSPYAFNYTQNISLSVDAAEVGNLSRFIQHAPLNFDIATQHARKLPDYDRKLPQNKQDYPDFWEWRNLTFKAGLTEDDIAWANLMYIVIPIQNVPCIVLYNMCKINKGDQLTISYGTGYWTRRNLKPALFDLKGGIISSHQYGYKEVEVNLPPIPLLKQFPRFEKLGVNKSYNAAMFQKDLQRKEEIMQPVWFSHLAEPVSIFKLREKLLQYNVIGSEYAAIENEFVSELQDILPSEFSIKMFERDPKQRSPKPIYDVVCTTKDLMKWSQLTILLKSPFFMQSAIQNKCLKLTQEVIIMDIGHDIEKQMLLLSVLRIANVKGHFEETLPDDLIPTGPRRGDPTALMMAKSETMLNQILIHNPGLTKEEINNTYKIINELFSSLGSPNPQIYNSTKIDEEKRLNTLTTKFFKDKPPATWKVYPSDQLKGKYSGHQVRFFTIPVEHSAQSEPFFNVLKQNGFEAELKKAGVKPSIVVDLNISKKI